VDSCQDAIGFHFVDKSYVVPRGDDPNYIEKLLTICLDEKINIILPCSDEEIFSLSQEKESFERNGVRILCSDFDITSMSADKGSMLNFLKCNNIPYPNFYLPTSVQETVEAAKRLGYPGKPIVVKPRKGRGGRGFRILKEKINVLGTRTSTEIKLEWFIESIREEQRLEIVLMEYLLEPDYSVDVLADNGKPLFIVSRKRIKALLGPSQIGEVCWTQEVVDMVELIVNKFGFNSIVNLQLKTSSYKKIPLIYEINPRISGTIVAATAAGVDLLNYGIRHTLGLEIPDMIIPKNLRMTRYLKEYFY
jgi:carbamoyl-phosphate synthase large subunit